MYRGRHILGTEVPLGCLTTNAAGTPTNPDDCPLMEVRSSSGLVLARRIPRIDHAAAAGLFQVKQFLGADFAAGRYSVLYGWTVGGTAFGALDEFEVIPGGHADGSVISMYFYDRPHGDFVVHQLDGGKIRRGRNPRV